MTYDPGPLPIRHVTDVRDLLVATMAADLTLYIIEEVDPTAQTASEQIIAFVLDHITAHSFQLLAQRQAQRETDKPPPSTAQEQGTCQQPHDHSPPAKGALDP